MLGNVLKIEDVKSEIGLLVKTVRRRKSISQTSLAEKLNVSRITIKNLESGKNFTIDTLLKVMQHLDLMKSFFEFINDKREQNENVKSLY